MEKQVATGKTEKILLGLTTLFLLVLLGLSWQDRRTPPPAPITVETEMDVPQEEILPDLTPLNLNQATAEELMELPGIGPKLAQRILEYRAAAGSFESVEELMEVSGIGEKKLEEFRSRVCVE